MKKKSLKVILSGAMISLLAKVYVVSVSEVKSLLYEIPEPKEVRKYINFDAGLIITIIAIPLTIVLGVIAYVKAKNSENKYLKYIILSICIIAVIILIVTFGSTHNLNEIIKEEYI